MADWELPRGSMTARELAEFKAKRLREDPEYRARAEDEEAGRAARIAEARMAEQSLVRDLRAIGVQVDSVWQVYRVADAIPLAVPTLLDHIQRPYPPTVVTGMGAALQNKASGAYWEQIKEIYLRANDHAVRDELAAVLSICAKRDNYGDLIRFVADPTLGESRLLFLRPINRIGNRIRPRQGRQVVESVASDPIFAREAAAILKGRGPGD